MRPHAIGASRSAVGSRVHRGTAPGGISGAPGPASIDGASVQYPPAASAAAAAASVAVASWSADGLVTQTVVAATTAATTAAPTRSCRPDGLHPWGDSTVAPGGGALGDRLGDDTATSMGISSSWSDHDRATSGATRSGDDVDTSEGDGPAAIARDREGHDTPMRPRRAGEGAGLGREPGASALVAVSPGVPDGADPDPIIVAPSGGPHDGSAPSDDAPDDDTPDDDTPEVAACAGGAVSGGARRDRVVSGRPPGGSCPEEKRVERCADESTVLGSRSAPSGTRSVFLGDQGPASLQPIGSRRRADERGERSRADGPASRVGTGRLGSDSAADLRSALGRHIASGSAGAPDPAGPAACPGSPTTPS